MRIIDAVGEGERVGRCSWRFQSGEKHYFATAVRLEEDDEIRLVQSPGAAPWEHVEVISREEAETLQLGEGRWVLVVRRWVQGKSLDEVTHRLENNWRQWAADLTYILQNVHAQKAVHGALRPQKGLVGRDRRLKLVGLLPVQREAGEESVVDGSPFMAPELEDGQTAPDRASDVYALAAMICWMAGGGEVKMGAPREHPSGMEQDRDVPQVPAGIDGPLASLIERALMATGEARPTVSDFYQALVQHPSVKPRWFVGLPPSLYRGVERAVVDALDEGEQAVMFEGAGETGKTFALRRLKPRLQATGRVVVVATSDRIEGPGLGEEAHTALERGPWEPVRRLVEVLEEHGGSQETRIEQAPRGADTLWHARRWLDRLRQALGDNETVVLWDDYDVTSPDVRWFWDYAMQRLQKEGDNRLRLVVASEPGGEWLRDAKRFEIEGPKARAWAGWRQRTQLSQVRRIGEQRFSLLVERHGARPVELFDAINNELGAEKIPEFARRRPSTRAVADASALFAGDWRRHLDELLGRGGCVQAAKTCEELYQVLTRSHPRERLQVLGFWMRAVEGTGYQPVVVDRLEHALEQTAELEASRAQARLMLGRLYSGLARWDEAVAMFDRIAPTDGPRQVELLRWKAQALALARRWPRALDVAEEGLEIAEGLDESLKLLRLHLETIQAGAEGLEGQPEAASRLRKLAGELQHLEAPVLLKAFCHRVRGDVLVKQGDPTEAVQAKLRAAEVMETAGRAAGLAEVLFEVGQAQRHGGRVGLAREYFLRAAKLVHGGSAESLVRRLAVETVRVALVFGRVGEAEEMLAAVEGRPDESVSGEELARWLEVRGAVARATGDTEQAWKSVRRALSVLDGDSELQVRLLAECADLAVEHRRWETARELLQKGASLAERHGLEQMDDLLSVVRARLQFSSGDGLEQLGTEEQLRHQLRRSIDRRRVEPLLVWVPRLWSLLDAGDQPETAVVVAQAFHRAVGEATEGLGPAQKEQLVDSLPSIPQPEQLEETEDAAPAPVEPPAPGRNQELIAENERLREQLRARQERIEQLEERIAELEKKLEKKSSSQKSNRGRGRRPKAKRDEVVEAMEDNDGDVEAAAAALGVSKRTMYRYLNRYDIDQ